MVKMYVVLSKTGNLDRSNEDINMLREWFRNLVTKELVACCNDYMSTIVLGTIKKLIADELSDDLVDRRISTFFNTFSFRSNLDFVNFVQANPKIFKENYRIVSVDVPEEIIAGIRVIGPEAYNPDGDGEYLTYPIPTIDM